jgi:hypothetical protein
LSGETENPAKAGLLQIVLDVGRILAMHFTWREQAQPNRPSVIF